VRIYETFLKNIDRDIKGVIKVGQDDDANMKQELEEYVVTRELKGHFAEFFANYKKSIHGNTDKNGVWISGFFGSGKSHFLKIISYLLDNRIVDGKRAMDYFIDDNKIEDNLVISDMKLCADMAPQTDVILFNIDSKSSQSSKHTDNAIVSVFLKVFNDMLGFCGAIPHLADLERDLSEAGRYDEFKKLFKKDSNKDWVSERHRFKFIQDKIVKILGTMDYMSETAARNWCSKAAGNYEISIESFAKLVADYINKKGKNHHVVFLVDEAGQYIGTDSRLMLNLQTVTEDLGTFTKGKAWVIVTSQQDIDAIAKDMGLRSNDFSKIQGRFDTRLSLSAAYVDDVIKRRILTKNDNAAQALRLLYEQKQTIIKNLIVFNDTVEKKLYTGEDDFAAVYPFVPYQFNLLASVLTSVRKHGASGKHLSEGERSMLALFKESAVRLMEDDIGAIVPFNIFYDTLHRFLDHSHAGVIIRAERNKRINPDNLETCFTVELLKTLFLVKYVSEIEANIDNLVSLMVDSVDTDRISLKREVEEALNTLVGQKLVQKSGNEYVFLTDEEQEINRAIDAQNVEMAEVTGKISNMIFEDIFSDRRYKYPAHNGRYTYAFNQYIDDHPHRINQSHDIGLRILTPSSDNTDEATLRMRSGQGKEVLVVLPDDLSYRTELQESMKIDKFLSSPSSITLTKYEQIKADKGVEMRRHAEDAKLFLSDALKAATIYVNGDKMQSGSKEITTRLNEALGRLVTAVYHKLSYIDTPFGEADIRRLFIKSGQISMTLNEVKNANTYALSDMRDYIAMNSDSHTKTSMKTLLDRFQKAPYGFVEEDVEWLVAKLFRDGDIAFTVNGAPVTVMNKSEDDIIRFITKKEYVEKLLTERREKANENQKKIAREVMKELFGTAGSSDEDDAIMQSFQKYAHDLIATIEKYEERGQGKPYPGRKILTDGKTLLRKLENIESSYEFFKTINTEKDLCLDFSEDFGPIKGFYDGEQRKIFDNALDKMRIYDESKDFIVDEKVEENVSEIKNILKMPEPYSAIPKLPGLIQSFTEAYMDVLNKMAKPIYESIENARQRVLDELNQKPYKDELVTNYINQFTELKNDADTCNNVATFKIIKERADALKVRLLNEMSKRDEELAINRNENTPTGDHVSEPGVMPVITPKAKRRRNISIKTINTSNTWQIESDEDIDKYLSDLRTRIKNELDEETIISIEF